MTEPEARTSNVHTSKRGIPVIRGQVMRTTTTDANHRAGREDNEHTRMLDFEHPDFEPLLQNILIEIAEERMLGKLKPFIEGEPIGVIPRSVRRRPMTEAMLRKERSARMERRRDEMLALRGQNDKTLEALWASAEKLGSPATPPSATT